MSIKYDPEMRAKAVRLFHDHVLEYPSRWAAMKAVSARLGMTAESLRQWVKRAEVGRRAGAGVDQRLGGRAASASPQVPRARADRRGAHSRDRFLRAGVRPAIPLTCEFITEHRQVFGVVPICRALTQLGVPIAPRTYYAHITRPPSKRALWEVTVTELLAGFYESDGKGGRAPESLYGSLKMWAHLRRLGFPVARCTVERLMRERGWQGVRRERTVRTTTADPAAARPVDLVNRCFTTEWPDALWVADFTYSAQLPVMCSSAV